MRISDWSSDVCSSDLHRHARAAMADLAARLDARRNLDLVGVAIGIGNLDHPAERGGREADRRARVERGALAIEQRMPRDMDDDVEIARRRAALARLAFAPQADARAPELGTASRREKECQCGEIPERH